MDDDLQHAFASYQEQFKAALDESAETLRQTISAAQQAISDQLDAGLLEQAKAGLARAVEFQAKPITADAVNEAFARARDVWDKVEAAAAETHAGLSEPPAAMPETEKPVETPPADPMAATQSLISQATQSLNSAMEAVIQAMNRPPRGPGQP